MNLGDRVECGKLTPTHIGLADKRVQSILTTTLDVGSITLGGSDLQTTLNALSGGSVSWDSITGKPDYLVDWTTDQGDTDIDSNNYTDTQYSLASNGTAGLTNFNFTQARRDKLAGIATGAEVRIRAGRRRCSTVRPRRTTFKTPWATSL
jgi:hypothetical protein